MVVQADAEDVVPVRAGSDSHGCDSANNGTTASRREQRVVNVGVATEVDVELFRLPRPVGLLARRADAFIRTALTLRQ
jgi:hypothetical protein